MAQLLNAPSRHFLIAMIVASIVGTFAGFWALLHNMYHFGADNVYHNIGDNRFPHVGYVDSTPAQPRFSDAPRRWHWCGDYGSSTCASSTVPRFPFHPVGFAVACGWMMGGIWFSVFVAWLIKWAILKFGGIQLYRRMVPFFIGIIFGTTRHRQFMDYLRRNSRTACLSNLPLFHRVGLVAEGGDCAAAIYLAGEAHPK